MKLTELEHSEIVKRFAAQREEEKQRIAAEEAKHTAAQDVPADYEAGVTWAKTEATEKQLNEIRKYMEIKEGPSQSKSADERVSDAMFENRFLDRWSSYLKPRGVKRREDFFKGALEVYEQISSSPEEPLPFE